MRFNLDGGAVKAKKQFKALDDVISYYASVKHPLPVPLMLFKKDFDLLMSKVPKVKGKTPKVTLFYRGIELKSQRV